MFDKIIGVSSVSIVYFYLDVLIYPWSKFWKTFDYAAWDCIVGSIGVCTSFILIFKFLICFLMDLEFQFSIIILKN